MSHPRALNSRRSTTPNRRTSTSPRRRALTALAAVPTLALLAACGSSDPAADSADPSDPSAGGSSAETAGSTYQAFTADNCGFAVEVDERPERILAIKSSMIELAAALGASDRLIGVAFSDGEPPADLAEDLAEVPVVSDAVPGQEALLELAPDLVLGGWESNFSADGAGERDALAGLGIATYVAPSACQGEGYQPNPLTFEGIFDDIREAGALLDASEAAEQVVADQQAVLDAVEPLDGQTAVWWSSGNDTPYIGTGIGAPQMILQAAGLTNAFGDVPETWSSIGWEEIVAADPDVFVLVDSTWNSAEDKIAALAANPATAGLDAVVNERYVVVPFAATEGGVRNADTAADIVDQVTALG